MYKKLTVRNFHQLLKQKNKDEGLPTTSSDEQCAVEDLVAKKLGELCMQMRLDGNLPILYRNEHILFMNESLRYLSSGYESLDASRTWICYWILHVLSLLESNIPDSYKSSISKFLAKCQDPKGGFGGGPGGHYAHLAPTYAAVNCLMILGTEEAYKVIDRESLSKFLWSLRQPDGAFCMHKDGEVDIRGVYCALAVASLTNILTKELCEGTAEWIVSCQTYEGGFSGCPGMEAHGGYTFCGLASLIILKKSHLCDTQALLRWLVNRQMKFEGGFQGRTNKLVDGCYSFWQGGAFPLINALLYQEGYTPESLLFDIGALQEYILGCCQHFEGGLLDKPGKPRDIYHSCYTISGLSIAQHCDQTKAILGYPENEVASTHAIFNIRIDLVRKALIYFNNLQQPNDLTCNKNMST